MGPDRRTAKKSDELPPPHIRPLRLRRWHRNGSPWTPTILNKIGPIVGDAIHDTDLMLWFTGDRVV